MAEKGFEVLDWDLYDIKGVGAVNRRISAAFATQIAKAKRKIEKGDFCRHCAGVKVRNAVYEVMERCAEFGARDTEPQGLLVSRIEEALGLEEYSLDRY